MLVLISTSVRKYNYVVGIHYRSTPLRKHVMGTHRSAYVLVKKTTTKKIFSGAMQVANAIDCHLVSELACCGLTLDWLQSPVTKHFYHKPV